MREQWQLANARQDRSVCLWLEDITRHPSSSRPWDTWPRAGRTTPSTDKNLPLVLQPPREEGRVLLLEEERRPRFTRFDDAVFESRQPCLCREGPAHEDDELLARNTHTFDADPPLQTQVINFEARDPRDRLDDN